MSLSRSVILLLVGRIDRAVSARVAVTVALVVVDNVVVVHVVGEVGGGDVARAAKVVGHVLVLLLFLLFVHSHPKVGRYAHNTWVNRLFLIEFNLLFCCCCLLEVGQNVRTLVPDVEKLAPLLDEAVELAATALAELVGRARMKGVALLARYFGRVPLVHIGHLAVVDALLALAQRLRVAFDSLGQLVRVDLVLLRHLFHISNSNNNNKRHLLANALL